jgi:hypothetical protein
VSFVAGQNRILENKLTAEFPFWVSQLGRGSYGVEFLYKNIKLFGKTRQDRFHWRCKMKASSIEGRPSCDDQIDLACNW